MAFSPDGGILASAGFDNAVRIWKVESGEEIRTLTGHSAGVLAVEFSPNGRTLVSAAGDGMIRLWKVDSSADPRPQGVVRRGSPARRSVLMVEISSWQLIKDL